MVSMSVKPALSPVLREILSRQPRYKILSNSASVTGASNQTDHRASWEGWPETIYMADAVKVSEVT